MPDDAGRYPFRVIHPSLLAGPYALSDKDLDWLFHGMRSSPRKSTDHISLYRGIRAIRKIFGNDLDLLPSDFVYADHKLLDLFILIFGSEPKDQGSCLQKSDKGIDITPGPKGSNDVRWDLLFNESCREFNAFRAVRTLRAHDAKRRARSTTRR